MKAAGAILLFIFCAASGMLAARRLSKRERTLRLCMDFLDAAAAELEYSMAPLDELLGFICASGGLDGLLFPERCLGYMERGTPFPQAFSQAVYDCREENAMNEADARLMASVGGILGAMDPAGQIKLLAGKRELLAQRYADARDAAVKKGRLWRSLGVMAGMCAVILTC